MCKYSHWTFLVDAVCRCLKILGKNETYILYFLPPPCPKIVPAPLRGLIFIDATNKFSNLKKKCNIARNIMCFIMNVIFARQKFSAHLIYLFFSKFSNRQNMFWSRNLSSNMPKIMSFSLKNRKKLPSAGALPPTPYAFGGWGLRLQTSTFALFQYESFAACSIITAAFTWHKEKGSNNNKISLEKRCCRSNGD